LAFSGVGNWQQSEKVEVHNYKRPLSNGIKPATVLQRLHDEIGRTISDDRKRDGQTNRQTGKKINVFGHEAASVIRAPPSLAW